MNRMFSVVFFRRGNHEDSDKARSEVFFMGLDSLKKTVKSTGTIAESECSIYVVRRTEVFRQRTDL